MKNLLILCLITFPLLGFAQENKVKKSNYFDDISNEERRKQIRYNTII